MAIEERLTAAGSKYPRPSEPGSSRMSRAQPCRSLRSQLDSGTEKPCLGRSRISSGQPRAQRLAQDPLLLPAADLVLRRDRGRELHHLVVQEGRARLERVGHGGDVDLRDEVVDEVGPGVDLEHPVDHGRRRRPPPSGRRSRRRRRPRRSPPRSRAVERAALGAVEPRDVARRSAARRVERHARRARRRTRLRTLDTSPPSGSPAAERPPAARRSGAGRRSRRAGDRVGHVARGSPRSDSSPPSPLSATVTWRRVSSAR